MRMNYLSFKNTRNLRYIGLGKFTTSYDYIVILSSFASLTR